MLTEFGAMIAIDWADQKHAWAMQPGASKTDMGAIDHTSEAIDVWAAELRMQFGGQSIAPAALTCRTESRQASKAPPFSDGEVRKAAARAEVRLNCLSIAADPRFCTESRRALTGSGCGHRTSRGGG